MIICQIVSFAGSETAGLSVKVTAVEYQPGIQGCQSRPHGFAYSIHIHNATSKAVTIRGRKWLITGVSGQAYVMEAEGVQGEFPKVLPGNTFSYDSYHLVDGDSFAQGAYLLDIEGSDPIVLQTHSFPLKLPISTETGKIFV